MMPSDLARIADALDALRHEFAKLSARVAALEAASNSPPSPLATTTPVAPVAEGLSEELVLVISAAIAAYLGKKAPIRQIRVLGTAGWAQQGRITIQASHVLQ
jgi:methylmalonyl-CoA carboxyltransferase large subunit